jgi:hypothetical protein
MMLGLLDCAAAWGSLLEPDLATMVEVIEHMEPHILERDSAVVFSPLCKTTWPAFLGTIQDLPLGVHKEQSS